MTVILMSDGDSDGLNEERPVVDTSIEATATAHTRPVVGQDRKQRTGTVRVRSRVVVECTCGAEVTLHSIQGSVICQGGTESEPCGRRWELK